MLSLLPILVAALLLLALLGISVVAWLPDRWRPSLLPAVLVLGAMVLVVGLHATSIIVGVRFGLVVVVLVGVIALAIRTRRVRWWVGLGGLRWLGAGLVAGLLPFSWAIAPARSAGAALIAPNGGDDAFSYVTVAAWLLDHPATQRPGDSTPEPAWGYTHVHLDVGLRIGEELDQAAIALAGLHDPAESFYTVMALWLLLLPGAAITAAMLLRAPPLAGLLGGLVAASSAVLGFQVINANSASLLGIAMSLPALAALVRTIDDRVAGIGEPFPLWLAAGMLAAWVGTYTEYLPLVGVGLAAFVLARRPPAILRAVPAALRLGCLAVAMAPLVWYDAIRSTIELSGTSDTGLVSSFLGAPLVVIGHLTGNRSHGDLSVTRLAVPLLAMMVAGVLLAALIGPARRFTLCVGTSALVVIVLLSSVHRYPYGQERAVEITFALFLLLSAIGLEAGIARLWRLRPAAGALAIVVAGITGAGFLFVNHRSVIGLETAADPRRQVDSSFADATQWLRENAGADGANGMVVSGEHFDQLWLIYQTRSMNRLTFPFVYPDYGGVEPFHFNDGRLRRFAVVDVSTFLDADPAVIVGGNARFRFLDLSRGQAVITVGANRFLPSQPRPDGSPTQWMIDDGDLLVVHTAGVPAVQLTSSALPQTSPQMVTINGDGLSPQVWTVTDESSSERVRVPREVQILHLHNSVPATHPNPGDPSKLSILLVGARRG